MRRRRRTLQPDELELWEKVQAGAVPLHRRPERGLERGPAPPKPAPPEIRAAADPQPPVLFPPPPAPEPKARRGSVSLDLRPDPLAPAAPAMDKRTFTRMRRGKVDPEARLDLHGLTLAEAHGDLTAFLLASHQLGRRLVLVITGKGARERPRDGQRGVLRHQVPQWMGLSPLRQVILQISEAHISHGGSGAFYVYLRRSRG